MTFAYIQAGLDHDDGYAFEPVQHLDEFDRWLAAHDEQVRAEERERIVALLDERAAIAAQAEPWDQYAEGEWSGIEIAAGIARVAGAW
jgi:hypothetical protein